MNEYPAERNDLAQRLRQTLHDGLCQQLAGSVLLQAMLIKRLEKLWQESPETAALEEIVADARRVGEAMHTALEEAREIIRRLA